MVDTVAHFIEIQVTYHPNRFNHGWGLKNHHLIVWEKGSAAGKALFTTPVPDSSIHDALVKIGTKPGNNLTRDTWAQRKDPRSPYPDMLVEGTPLKIEIRKDSLRFHVEDILDDKNSRPFDFRFGGNRGLISTWKSGCVACLQSCPGGKIGNHAYSIRDLVKGNSVFMVKPAPALKDGDILSIRITMLSRRQ
jgi:hypothetical protein